MTKPTPTHEVHPASYPARVGTYEGACRLCHFTTITHESREAAVVRIEFHVVAAHETDPVELA